MLFKENFSEKIWNILTQKQQKVYIQIGYLPSVENEPI